MKDKIISINKFKQKKELKMLLLIILIGATIGSFTWHYFVENVANIDVEIPQSKNFDFKTLEPVATSSIQIANEFEEYENKPILIYIYTTWCESCKNNFNIFNEIAREFQETDLKIIAIAIDRNMTKEALNAYFANKSEIYFPLKFLSFKDGFKELLEQKQIKYNGRIPFTALISRDGKVIAKYSGVKNKNYLRNKIIKELYK